MRVSSPEYLTRNPLKLPNLEVVEEADPATGGKKYKLRDNGQPKLTYSQRKEQLDTAVFIHIRILVYNIYQKPDGTPLMSYQETLDNRDKVKQQVLQYELASGDILPDGTEKQPTTEPVTIQGETIPMFQPTPTPPTQQESAPEEKAQPEPVPARSIRRPGSAVAPPPPPTNLSPPPQVPMTPTPQIPPFVPYTPAQSQVPAVPAQQATGPTTELKPLIDRIDAIGKMVAEIGNHKDMLSVKVDTLAGNINQEIAQLKALHLQVLTAIHHLYLSNPATAQNTQGKANTVQEFQAYLAPFFQGVPR